jgi:pyruvate dehydrogenase E2 component (dihydrolipoamide acetyltransferase)
MPIDILMPALSPTMTEGRLAKWHKQTGDKIQAGDVIAEIETDKATMEYEAVDEGVLGQILIAEGTDGVAVNTPIAVLLGEGETASTPRAAPAVAPAAAPAAAPAPVAGPAVAPVAAPVAQAPSHPPSAKLFATPLARRLAKERGVDLTQVPGSGPHGRIIARDVPTSGAGQTRAAPAPAAPRPVTPSAPVVPTAADRVVPHDGMRRTVARRLTESVQSIPHFNLTIDVEIDKLLALRKEVNAADESYKVSVNDFVLRASALALQKVPEVNASWSDAAMIYHSASDVALAVAIDGGLITPIIFNANQKSVVQIAREAKDLAERARTRKLKPEEFQGGSFAVSNLGMFGIKAFNSIINPPHAAILSVGAGEPRPIVRDGQLAIATVMTVTLAIDHRVMGGAEGAKWLQAFKALIETPIRLVV